MKTPSASLAKSSPSFAERSTLPDQWPTRRMIVVDDPYPEGWVADFSDRYLDSRPSEPLVGIDDWDPNDH